MKKQKRTVTILLTMSLFFCLRYIWYRTYHIFSDIFIVSSWLPFSFLCIATEIVDLYTNSGKKSGTFQFHCLSVWVNEYLSKYEYVKAPHLLHLRRYDVRLSALPLGRCYLHRDQPNPVCDAQLQLPEGVPDCGGENKKHDLQSPGHRIVKRSSVIHLYFSLFIVLS